jgi:hypothetical protein
MPRLLAPVVAAFLLTSALAIAPAALAGDSIPPTRTLGPGRAAPVTFKTTLLGTGMKRGQHLPRTATIRKQVFPDANDANGFAVNIDAPEHQAIVAW